MPMPMPMPMTAAHWPDSWAPRTSFRAAEGCSAARKPPQLQSSAAPQHALGDELPCGSACEEQIAAGVTTDLAIGVRGIGDEKKRGPQTEEVAAKEASAAASASPDPEDICTDSWLTGLPWASSSPPNLDTKVEGELSPTPLDALRSDDRGTRDSDADDVGQAHNEEEEPVLFTEQYQAPPPTSVLQEALEVAGCGGASLGQQDNRFRLDRNEGSKISAFPKDGAGGTVRGTSIIEEDAAVLKEASSSPPASTVKRGGQGREGKSSEVRLAAVLKMDQP
ncbi:unnamed protein product, partial [Scytosiphon promiscuus]